MFLLKKHGNRLNTKAFTVDRLKEKKKTVIVAAIVAIVVVAAVGYVFSLNGNSFNF